MYSIFEDIFEDNRAQLECIQTLFCSGQPDQDLTGRITLKSAVKSDEATNEFVGGFKPF
jgi:hypothetical protein